MRVLDGEGTLVRVFIGRERSVALRRVQHASRAEAGRPAEHRGAGIVFLAEALHDGEGQGGLRLSEDLPVVIEVVEASDRIEQLLSLLDEMVLEGLVTMEKVRIMKYSPGTRKIESRADGEIGRDFPSELIEVHVEGVRLLAGERHPEVRAAQAGHHHGPSSGGAAPLSL